MTPSPAQNRGRLCWVVFSFGPTISFYSKKVDGPKVVSLFFKNISIISQVQIYFSKMQSHLVVLLVDFFFPDMLVVHLHWTDSIDVSCFWI